MTQPTYTPGPWHIDDSQIIWAGEIVVAAAGRIDAPVQANARLIAAAPELLAALETLLEGACEALSFLDRETVKHLKPLIDTAEAAITKAKGE